jgi:DNA-binding response OmpR family regulator
VPASAAVSDERDLLDREGHIGPGMELLTKPFAIDDLGRRVERMLRRNE